MSEIKIFVSHRIDQNSITIANPLFVDMRCGAIEDSRKGVTMLGDDTGDNISGKRLEFNELTVIYWAWKNCDADYYGLCHYRRYFSFAKEEFTNVNGWGCISHPHLDKNAINKYGLTEKAMRQEIESCDIIIPEIVDFGKIGYTSNFDVLQKLPEAYIMSDVEILFDIIKERHPDYYDEAIEYMNGTKSWLYNCFIMKKEVFRGFCEWFFDILFEFERRIDMTGYTPHMRREPAHLAERLCGIYINRLVKEGKYNIKTKQWVIFKEVAKIGTMRKIKDNFAKPVFRWFCPYGTRRYVLVKSLYFKLRGWPYDSTKDKRYKQTEARKVIDKLDRIQRTIDRNRVTQRQLLSIACWANQIRDLHKEVFHPYKYCNMGRDIVLVATGPTLKYYTALPNAKHIGVNGAYKKEDITLDYFFMQDCRSIGHTVEVDGLKALKCDKFLGMYYSRNPDEFGCTDYMARQIGAKRYVCYHAGHWQEIPFNIEYFPLMDHLSVTFAALSFALYTHPKRIFLAGSDASTSKGEHFNETKGANILYTKEIVEGYRMLKKHVNAFYPEIKIISINPVGLKGIFDDVYTQSYLDIHPEIEQELGDSLVLLDDIITKEGNS